MRFAVSGVAVAMTLCEAAVPADELIPDSYLLEAQTSGDSTEDSRGTDLLVAVTPKRVLAGWSVTAGDDTFRRRHYVYSSTVLTKAVSIEMWSEGDHLTDAQDLVVDSLVEQQDARAAPGHPRAWLSRAIVGPPGNLELACFFSMPTRAVFPADVESFDLTNGHAESENSFGVFRLTTRDDSVFMTFEQKEDSLLGDYLPVPLAEFESRLVPNGYSRITHECVIQGQQLGTLTAPWVARVTREMVPREGEPMTESRRMTVSRFVTEREEVDRVIDGILARIPDGFRVISGDQVMRRWNRDGATVVVGEPASWPGPGETLMHEKNAGAGHRWILVIITNTLIVAAVVLAIMRRRRRA